MNNENKTRTSAIQVFNFEQSQIRIFSDENGDPLFIASDVCKILELTNPTEALRPLAPFEKAKLNLGPKNPNANAITESGLYTLILRSRDATKEGTLPYRFRLWVCGNVIPSIRKTGQYSVNPQFQIPKTFSEALRLAADLEERNQLLTQKIETDKPLVEFAEDIQQSDEDFLIREAAKLLGVKVKFLFTYLRENKWIMKKSSEPYAVIVHQGLMSSKVRQYEDKDGEKQHSVTGCIRFKGLKKLHESFKNLGKIPSDHQLKLDLA